MKSRIVVALFPLFAVAFACNNPSSTQKESPQAKKAVATISPEAREAFNTRCASCHGTEGKGNGPAAAALNPKPRDYTDKNWQKSVTDEQIKKTITMGGAAVGKSPIMPASPDLESNPQMLDGLVAIIRQFGS
jgi:cytochrome c553